MKSGKDVVRVRHLGTPTILPFTVQVGRLAVPSTDSSTNLESPAIGCELFPDPHAQGKASGEIELAFDKIFATKAYGLILTRHSICCVLSATT